jgi:hypothetical protein
VITVRCERYAKDREEDIMVIGWPGRETFTIRMFVPKNVNVGAER